jgi:peroxiredoxin
MILPLLVSFLSIVPLQDSSAGLNGGEGISSDSLTVYIFLLDECIISQFYTPELTRLNDRYKSKGVGFIGYFPNTASSPEEIELFAKDYHIDFPLKADHEKFFTKKFDITVTPEVAVWDHRSDRLIYRGRIDDSYVRVGKRKLHPQNHDLEDMIKSWIAMELPDQLTETQAIGCFINFDTTEK